MKKILLLIFIFSSLIAEGTWAQDKKVNPSRPGQKKMIVKKKSIHRFPRKNVVVVKKGNNRVIAVLPKGHTNVFYRGGKYFYHGGFYYRKFNDSFRMVAPPVGLKVKILPSGYRQIIMHGKPCYYYQGMYYSRQGSEYEIVKPEVGTMVPEIPQDVAEQVVIDDVSYYEVADILYKSVETAAGTQYEVAGELEAMNEAEIQ